ncbi:hypothetical protein PICMEDRAFT_16046 [Pichia membranifaciens NRRL Y-2026]|uniref:Uncharacterized protein n=1 Tax=Pichia membranifaciens NRRL Y-2026 TaxID=763406 RepID=A0A1E3NQB4_9ASCO|nr:hypothetical protein PICMEDRAFT_16046 [Pichia membranifaciens NRRL Y-2026]ODQ48236.1 hypothetical protein PICMEDRAFT_16046 [Pichia membranifaciens NRRL Y-2026]
MHPVQHMGPVCSLKVFSNKWLFSGEGPSLKIYDYVTGEKLFERIIFKRNKIHGIEYIDSNVDGKVESDVKIVVWGGRSLSILTLAQLKNPNFEIPHQGVGDWIFHCIFKDQHTLHILNSHNIVHTISTENEKPQLLSSKSCDWKSILYSGTLHKNTETGKVTVLAGTVMNGILIWDLKSGEVQNNLTQHEGSVYCVVSSPDGKYVVSCSDDRSIKVWNKKTGKLLANGWGHGSRIWGLSVYNVTDSGFNIFSSSEDCTSRIWTFNYSGSDELTQDKIILGHTGRHVWSVAVDDQNKIGFTGGADGKILVTDLATDKREGFWGHKWELKDVSCETGYNFIKGELIKEYVDFGHGLLAVTSGGKLMILKHYKKWLPLFEDSKFKRSCLLKAFKEDPIAVIGNKHGDVIIMKFNENCELVLKNELKLEQHFSRLGNILINQHNNKLFVLFESPNPKDCIVYSEIDRESLTVMSDKLLRKPIDKIILSSVAYDTQRDYLFIGCRFATLLVYSMSDNQNEPIAIFKNFFKGDTISSIEPLNESQECTLYLTDRDGSYHLIKINEELEYEFLQSSRIQKGFLEGIIRLSNGDTIFYGFKSDSFFAWNETKQYEIMREICGGPHRRWMFKHWIDKTSKNLKYRFVYTRASEVQIIEIGDSYAVELLAAGLHGREIRDICWIDAVNDKNEKVVITGAEDTTLKIGTLKSNGEYTLHWTYREHVAGLQSIHPVNSEYIMSSSALEELFLWKITKADGKKCMALHGSLPPSEENPDLRIMNFDTIEIVDSEKNLVGFLLVSAYSNSAIKVFQYTYSTKKFTLLIDDYYMKCCIFHAKFLSLNGKLYILIGSTNGHITLYNVQTNIEDRYITLDVEVCGKVRLQEKTPTADPKPSKLGKWTINQQMHQSSIKALELIQVSPDKVTVLTGGDDNALIVSKLQSVEGTEVVTVDVKSFNPSAASSTITTIKAVDQNTVLVGAVDQSLRLWDIRSDLKLVEDNYTTVADTGCAEIVDFGDDKKLALVGGSGFSIIKI